MVEGNLKADMVKSCQYLIVVKDVVRGDLGVRQ